MTWVSPWRNRWEHRVLRDQISQQASLPKSLVETEPSKVEMVHVGVQDLPVVVAPSQVSRGRKQPLPLAEVLGDLVVREDAIVVVEQALSHGSGRHLAERRQLVA